MCRWPHRCAASQLTAHLAWCWCEPEKPLDQHERSALCRLLWCSRTDPSSAQSLQTQRSDTPECSGGRGGMFTTVTVNSSPLLSSPLLQCWTPPVVIFTMARRSTLLHLIFVWVPLNVCWNTELIPLSGYRCSDPQSHQFLWNKPEITTFIQMFMPSPSGSCRMIRVWSPPMWFLTQWTWAWTRQRQLWWPKSWSSCCWMPFLWAVTFLEQLCPTTTTFPGTWCCPLWAWSWETECCWMTQRSDHILCHFDSCPVVVALVS